VSASSSQVGRPLWRACSNGMPDTRGVRPFAGGCRWGCPNFITGAGAIAEAFAFGYLGLAFDAASLTLKPLPLPEGHRLLRARGIQFQGALLDVQWDGKEVAIVMRRRPQCTRSTPTAGLWIDGKEGDVRADYRHPASSVAASFRSRPWSTFAPSAAHAAPTSTADEACAIEVRWSSEKLVLTGPTPLIVHVPPLRRIDWVAEHGCEEQLQWEVVQPMAAAAITLAVVTH